MSSRPLKGIMTRKDQKALRELSLSAAKRRAKASAKARAKAFSK